MIALRFFVLFFVGLMAFPAMAQDKGNIYSRLNFHRSQLNYDSAIYYNNALIAACASDSNNTGHITAIFQKANTLTLFNKYSEAFQLVLTTQNEFCGEKATDVTCDACNYIYRKLGEFMVLMQDYRQGMRYLEMTCNKEDLPQYYYEKALFYCYLNQPDSALSITAKCIATQQQKGNANKLISAYNNHGIIARRLEQYNEAIEAFSNAIQTIDSTGTAKNLRPIVMGNLGSCYNAVGNQKQAYECLLIDAEGSMKARAFLSYINAVVNMAEIEIEQQQYDVAMQRLSALLENNRIDTLLKQYNTMQINAQKLAILELLMEGNKLRGNETQYEYYSKQWISLNKQESELKMQAHQALVEEYSANALRQVTQQMETEKQLMEQQMMVMEKEEEKKQLSNWLLISGLAFSTLLLLFLFWRYRAVQTKKSIIKEAELSLAKKEQEILELKVKEEARSVQTLSLELMAKKDVSKSLLGKLHELENVSKVDLKKMGMFIQNELDLKSTRAQLQHEMGELNVAFYSELKVRYPELTETDLKLAAMIVMNMSNKEIAISKSITPESVKIAKNRLKKKMGLAGNNDLHTHLSELL